jgi:hypothetical protein
MAESDIDRAMQSFALKNCRINQELKSILRKHTEPKLQAQTQAQSPGGPGDRRPEN